MGFLKIDQLDELYLIGIFLALVYCFLNYKLLSLRDDLHYFSWRRKALNYVNFQRFSTPYPEVA